MFKNISFSNITQALLLLGIAVLPLLVLPFTEQFIIHSKMLVLFATTLIISVLYGVYVLFKKDFSVVVSPITVPAVAFGAAVLASSFLTDEYPIRHFIGTGGMYLTLPVLVLLGGSLVKAKSAQSILNGVLGSLLVANTLLFLSSIAQLLGYGPTFLLNQVLPVELASDLSFNMTGSSLVAFQLAIVTLTGIGVALYKKATEINLVGKVAAGVTAGSALLHGWSMLPGGAATPTILPWSISWSIVLDTFRLPRTAAIGFGPENLTSAIGLLRPGWLNGTDLWNLNFIQASNLPFSLIIATGLAGFVTMLWLFYSLYKSSDTQSPQAYSLVAMALVGFGLMIFVPPSVTIFGVVAIMLALWVGLEENKFPQIHIKGFGLSLNTTGVERKHEAISTASSHLHSTLAGSLTNKVKGYKSAGTALVGLLIIAVSLWLVYGYGRTYAAEMKLLASTKAAQAEDVIGVYTLQQEAIQLNPYIDTFRRRYGLTNLNIAIALAENEDATEQELAQVASLIEQAIREGRAATALNPSNSENWLVLGQIYANLMGAIEDAGQWAVTSYLSAIQLSPTNPLLLIELGNIFFSAEEYRQAAQIFEQAISLKPDLAIGYYLLANALVQMEAYLEARLALQQTLMLLEADSDDYIQAAQELADLEEFIEQNPDLIPQVMQEGTQGSEMGDLTQDSSLISPDSEMAETLNDITSGQPGSLSGPDLTSQNLIPASETIQPGDDVEPNFNF